MGTHGTHVACRALDDLWSDCTHPPCFDVARAEENCDAAKRVDAVPQGAQAATPDVAASSADAALPAEKLDAPRKKKPTSEAKEIKAQAERQKKRERIRACEDARRRKVEAKAELLGRITDAPVVHGESTQSLQKRLKDLQDAVSTPGALELVQTRQLTGSGWSVPVAVPKREVARQRATAIDTAHARMWDRQLAAAKLP